MPYRTPKYIQRVIEAIENYQFEHFLSDRELSIKAGLSVTMISKIKKGTTFAKLSTLRKMKAIGIEIPRPNKKDIEEIKDFKIPTTQVEEITKLDTIVAQDIEQE